MGEVGIVQRVGEVCVVEVYRGQGLSYGKVGVMEVGGEVGIVEVGKTLEMLRLGGWAVAVEVSREYILSLIVSYAVISGGFPCPSTTNEEVLLL